ncbi:MAG TPA: acyl-ACP--UDP-N-acetylglucosamine O-acyltransferase [Phycisphaerales bacterium]|nr:acyl-ACP--UDP-N-acetylglucosamine O-acyltransferase [Phycisphaerales bacterium]
MSQIHPSAVVAKKTQLAETVSIGPNCVVESGVSIGAGTELCANVVIGKDVKIGVNNQFFANCVIGGRPQILGSNSQTEIGGLSIGDNNTIREQVTIHPSMYPGELTKVGNDNLLMIGAHVGHDCVLEDSIVMSNYVQLSGHCKIETGVWLSGLVAVQQFCTIGKWCYAAGMAGINHDVPPFLVVSGHYPPRVRGVNKRGMKRAGLSEEQQDKIFEAYKNLYRQDGSPLLERAKALAAENGLDENVQAILKAIMQSSEQRFGRYLEKFRH